MSSDFLVSDDPSSTGYSSDELKADKLSKAFNISGILSVINYTTICVVSWNCNVSLQHSDVPQCIGTFHL